MKTVVIGAGATGLAAGYLLVRAGAEVVLIEAADEPGGLLATLEVGGNRLERFYHHFFNHDAEIHWLLGELGLRDAVSYHKTSMGVFREGSIHPFNGPSDLLQFSPISPPARLRFGLASLLLAYAPNLLDDERTPALQWLERWAGTEATRAIWEPLLRSKFGPHADRIPVAWLSGRLRQRQRSRDGFEEELGYLRGSLQVLVDSLVEAIESGGGEFRLSTPATDFLLDGNRVTGVATPSGELGADLVLSTLPTPILARLLPPTVPDYTERLASVRYMGVVCTLLAVSRPVSPVYWLNVADPEYHFGGVIEQTRLVPPSAYGGHHLLYLSRYLEAGHPLWSMDQAQIQDEQIDQLEKMFRARIRPHLLNRWTFRGRYAAPVTDLSFSRRIPSYATPLDNLFVASMPHVYPDERSTNNSIRIAASALKAAGFDMSDVPEGNSLAGRYGWR